MLIPGYCEKFLLYQPIHYNWDEVCDNFLPQFILHAVFKKIHVSVNWVSVNCPIGEPAVGELGVGEPAVGELSVGELAVGEPTRTRFH